MNAITNILIITITGIIIIIIVVDVVFTVTVPFPMSSAHHNMFYLHIINRNRLISALTISPACMILRVLLSLYEERLTYFTHIHVISFYHFSVVYLLSVKKKLVRLVQHTSPVVDSVRRNCANRDWPISVIPTSPKNNARCFTPLLRK